MFNPTLTFHCAFPLMGARPRLCSGSGMRNPGNSWVCLSVVSSLQRPCLILCVGHAHRSCFAGAALPCSRPAILAQSPGILFPTCSSTLFSLMGILALCIQTCNGTALSSSAATIYFSTWPPFGLRFCLRQTFVSWLSLNRQEDCCILVFCLNGGYTLSLTHPVAPARFHQGISCHFDKRSASSS